MKLKKEKNMKKKSQNSRSQRNKQQNYAKSNTMEVFNKETGLTPIQENAINLLLSGDTISSVAQKLKIDRSTIYQWQSKENFQAYYNYLNEKIKFTAESELIGLYNQAIQALKDSLNASNHSVRLRAACWLLEKIDSKPVGESDPRKMIEEKCSEEFPSFEFKTINHEKFKFLLEENNLIE